MSSPNGRIDSVCCAIKPPRTHCNIDNLHNHLFLNKNKASKAMGEEEHRSQPPPHIAILADPGIGHLIPLAALAKHLHQALNFSVTLITQPTSLSYRSQQSILNTLPRGIQTISLPQIPIQSVPNNTKPHELNLLVISRNLPHLRETLTSMKPNITAPIVDMFIMMAFDVVKELGIEVYLFFTSSCSTLCLAYHLPRVEDERVKGGIVRAPDCMPIEERDLPEPFDDADRESDAYKKFLQFLNLFLLPKAVLVNSFEELEPGPTKALKSDKSLPPIYLVGPLILSSLSAGDSDGHRCLQWLDEQPKGSVVYVSFGSGGTLSSEQMRELALGLEISGQRFIWVVKSPNESEVSADYLGANNAELDPLEFMPSGFIERTKGLGLIVPAWAPQREILSHWATGGFVTHCGWNSTLESIINGVPLIVWPLYAEQKVNALMLTEDLKVAVRVKVDGDGIVRNEEIARLVRGVMEEEEGKRLKLRMMEIKNFAVNALEEGGSSYKCFSEIARKLNNKSVKE